MKVDVDNAKKFASSQSASRIPFTVDVIRHASLLARYVMAERSLLAASTIFGFLGLSLPFVFPGIIAALIDHVVLGHAHEASVSLSTVDRLSELRHLTCYAAAAAVAFAIVGFGKGHYTLKLGNRIIARLRLDLFRHLQGLSLSFFSRQRTGTLVWQLTNDVNGIANLIYAGVLLLAFDVIQLGIALAVLCYLSTKLALAVIAVLPFYFVTLALYNPRVRAASDAVTQQLATMSGRLHEQFSAISLVKANGAELYEERRFGDTNDTLLTAIFHQSRLGHAMGAISEGVIHLGTTVIIGYGGWLAFSDPHFTVGMLTAFIGYVGIMYGPVHRCADLNLVYQNSWASARRILRIFDVQPSIEDRPYACASAPLRGNVAYLDVSFRYPESEAGWSVAAVSQVNLCIGAGERVALVGTSGAGKTTLGLLLARLYEAESGQIQIDGIDVRDYRIEALRASIAVVQQDTVLLSGSIRDNIAYANPEASDAEVIAAAKAANAHEFIAKLEFGYATELGERGVNLSGGQRQRISIARAVLKNPRILILDEATSSLDTESEFLVQEALDQLMRGRTTLLIAHRLSTVKSADRIYAMQAGRIVECGTHEELIARRGVYAHLSIAS